ncbi:MAG: winged helix-turn-helix domain-containing protein [Thermoplasmatota archaeon]
MPKAYRSRGQVMAELLAVIQREGPVGVTRLTSAANLTHGRMQEQLARFQQSGLIEMQEGEKAGWVLTARGHQALEELRRIERAMQDFGIHL